MTVDQQIMDLVKKMNAFEKRALNAEAKVKKLEYENNRLKVRLDYHTARASN